MGNSDLESESEFGSGAIDRVAEWLDRRSGSQALSLVAASIAAVAILDFSTHSFELCIGTLYIVPICLAAWMFPTREAIATTALVTFIAFLKYPLLNHDPNTFTTIYNGTSRAFAFSLLTAIMLGFRRNYEHVKRAASRDGMTGALNKEGFHQHVQSMLGEAEAAGRTVLLFYIDLDGFKAVNDRYGHHAGDDVLRSFASNAARMLRRGDCFGRIGGDEFAVAMQLPANSVIPDLAGNLHSRFSSTLAGSDYGVTCSTGALVVPAGVRVPYPELIKAADRLMYRSKTGGKNALTIGTIAHQESISNLPSRVGKALEA